MNRPPDDETPSTGVATGLGVDVEAAVRARSIDLNTPPPPSQTSNVIPFPSLRGSLRKPPELVEIVEIIHVFGVGFNEFWIAAAGPERGPDMMVRGGRHPWTRQAVFPHTEPAEAAYYAREMAMLLDVPIFDLAGILDTRVEGPGNGGTAA